MPLIPYVDLAQTSSEVREAFGRFPRTLNIFRIMAHADGIFLPWMRLSDAAYRKCALDGRLRELVILLVARASNAAYIRRQHEALSLKLGVPQGQVDAIGQLALESELFSEKERVLLRFALQVIETVRADETAVEAMKDHFSAREIVEVIFTVGQYMLAARLTETARIEIDRPATDEEVRKALRLG